MSDVDAIVVGAGFGSLGAALHLAENGARVVLLERTAYPGGCACTFEKGGASYEGGATLFSGFDEGQLFRRWIDDHSMDVDFELLDPPLELRAPGGVTLARRDREALRAQFEALPGAPIEGLRGFFRLQEKVAAALWPTLEDEKLLPPLTPARVLRHAVRLPRYLPLARLAGRPLIRVLQRFGLQDFQPLVTWLDAQCQITIQCGVKEAEAPFALAALDYHHRGAVHVKGGIGRLAWAMAEAVDRSGGVVRFSTVVKSATREEDGRWSVTARGATYRAPWILFNTLPQDAARIAGVDHPGLRALTERVGTGWSAGMLYRTLVPPRDAGPGARHLELVADESKPFLEGNHVFLSIGAEGEGVESRALRRCTVSTHIDPARINGRPEDEQREYVERVQEAMRATIRAMAPEWDDAVTEFTGSARTFARWTGRSGGLVGGIPRRAGLGQYKEVFGRRLPEGLRLVGDSVFPGQSTYAVAAGGVRVAAGVLSGLGSRRSRPGLAQPGVPVSPGA